MSAVLPRRGVLFGLAAMPLPVAAQEPHPDATLLAHRAVLLAAISVADLLLAEHDRLCAQARDEVSQEPSTDVWTPGWGTWDDRYQEARRRNGGQEAWQRWTDAEDQVEMIIDRFRGIPARTLDGLYVKALAATRGREFAEEIVADLLALGGEA